MNLAEMAVPHAEAGLSWGEFYVSDLLTKELAGTGLTADLPCYLLEEADEESDSESKLLMSEGEQDDDSFIALLGHVANPAPSVVPKAGEGDSFSPILDLDLQDVCKRDAAKFSV